MEYVLGHGRRRASATVVVTSGIDGIYPKGFVIGTIESVERGAGAYREIAVRPAVDFSRARRVLVVLTPPAPAPSGRRRRASRASEGCRRCSLALALALALQTTLARFVVGGTRRPSTWCWSSWSTWR